MNCFLEVFQAGAPLSDSSPLQENFCGTSIIVPDLEAVFYLKEDGKKSWKQRLFQLRASGIYYVPKGKTKVRVQSLYKLEANDWVTLELRVHPVGLKQGGRCRLKLLEI